MELSLSSISCLQRLLCRLKLFAPSRWNRNKAEQARNDPTLNGKSSSTEASRKRKHSCRKLGKSCSILRPAYKESCPSKVTTTGDAFTSRRNFLECGTVTFLFLLWEIFCGDNALALIQRKLWLHNRMRLWAKYNLLKLIHKCTDQLIRKKKKHTFKRFLTWAILYSGPTETFPPSTAYFLKHGRKRPYLRATLNCLCSE